MCGIAGLIDLNRATSEDALRCAAIAMSDALRHRGPDGSGIYVDAVAGIAFGHRRLAIIDLSEHGHQPMFSADRRYVLTFNGEMYNFQEIRDELEEAGLAPPWRGHSDTEVFLAAVSAWGLTAALARFVGMFAFALWDAQLRTLHLARDRFGEKPLYYGTFDNIFAFASELKALRRVPGWRGEVDTRSIASFVRSRYVPTPHSIYSGVRKLDPGSIAEIDEDGCAKVSRYWSPVTVAESSPPFAGSDKEAELVLEQYLRRSIRGQMISDVPLGAFLSGGVDSSTVVALMQAESRYPVKTFTIGFHESEYDEAPYARAVAKHLGTEHTELYVTPEEALAVVPQLPAMFDEPFADPSQIPTHLVAAMARHHVTVSLSGDGGDELFGGYQRYWLAHHLWSMMRFAPRSLRNETAALLTRIPTDILGRGLGWMGRYTSRYTRPGDAGDKILKVSALFGARSSDEIYQQLVSTWKDPATVVAGACEHEVTLLCREAWPRISDPIERLMWLDVKTYLPDDILVKLDRAAMAVGLEGRIPLLDHRLVNFLASLPRSVKAGQRDGKRLLTRLLYKYVPRELVDRPKKGFGVPIDSWIRGPLRAWAEDLLSERRLRQDGFFVVDEVRRKWREHLDKSRNWQYELWAILMFQAWHDSTQAAL